MHRVRYIDAILKSGYLIEETNVDTIAEVNHLT